jgi:hypothetical protein
LTRSMGPEQIGEIALRAQGSRTSAGPTRKSSVVQITSNRSGIDSRRNVRGAFGSRGAKWGQQGPLLPPFIRVATQRIYLS